MFKKCFGNFKRSENCIFALSDRPTVQPTDRPEFYSRRGFCRVFGPQNFMKQAHIGPNWQKMTTDRKSLRWRLFFCQIHIWTYSEELSSLEGFGRVLEPQYTLKQDPMAKTTITRRNANSSKFWYKRPIWFLYPNQNLKIPWYRPS